LATECIIHLLNHFRYNKSNIQQEDSFHKQIELLRFKEETSKVIHFGP